MLLSADSVTSLSRALPRSCAADRGAGDMGQSQRLKLRDVRSAFRLVGECRELGADSRVWRTHAHTRLCELLGCRVSIGGEVLDLWNDAPRLPRQVIDLGWENDQEQAMWGSYMVERFKAGPVFHAMQEMTGHQRTCWRGQVVDDQDWYRSIDYNEYLRHSRIDHALLSYYTLPEDPAQLTDAISLHRDLGDKGFSLRDVRMLRLFHAEVGLLIGPSLATASEPSASELAPRARQVLDCLLEGDSEKQVARRLGISGETVHHYTKIIYRHFRVQTRAELIARWLRFRRSL
jgi:DNA-binding CsgD family transcriptional regulator